MQPSETKIRYRFDRFVVSPSRRAVLCDGREVALIPRYLDLLLLLIERRGEAIHRREILDRVWSDVVVSDGALSQAVRMLRRVLEDDPRQPKFIRTVPRHGYRFVYADVIVESDDDPPAAQPSPDDAAPHEEGEEDREDEEDGKDTDDAGDTIDDLVERLMTPSTTPADEDDRCDAALRLHVLGTAEALGRVGARPGHEAARALLRDTRWEVAGAGPVPVLGQPGALRTSAILFRLRLARVLRQAGSRWLTGITGATATGIVAGACGALVLRLGPGSNATNAIFVALPLVGALVAACGAMGVAGGLSAAEVLFRSRRWLALVVCGGCGGAVVGATGHLIGRIVLEGLFGQNLAPVGGGLEGLVIGAAVGLGYGWATPMPEGGMATPRGAHRFRAALLTGGVTAVATGLLGWSGSHLGAMSLDFMAQTFPGSQVGLQPLARLLGESTPGVVTRVVISAWEGLLFGAGLVAGLTRRPGQPGHANAGPEPT